MIEQRFPTKAEVTISPPPTDGADAPMLSRRNRDGRYPDEAVGTMRRIADVVTSHQQESLISPRSRRRSARLSR